MRKHWWMIGIGGLGLMLLYGWFFWPQIGGKENIEAAPAYQPVPVSRGQVKVSIDTSGRVFPMSSDDLFPSCEGRVSWVMVEPGLRVQKGQILVTMESSAAEVAQAQAMRNQEETKYLAALAEYERTKMLFQEQAVTEQQWENIRQTFANAGLTWKAAKMKYARTVNGGGEKNLTAPYDGIVTEVYAKTGSYVTTESVLVRLASAEKMMVNADIDEIDIEQIQPGQQATITIDALSGEEFMGRVITVGEIGRDQGGVVSFQIKVLLINLSRRVKPGMSADVAVITAQRDDTLYVPNAAVEYRLGKPTVRLYLEGGKVQYRRVQSGMRTETVTEIISGLTEGENVAVSVAGEKPNRGVNESGGGNAMMFTSPF